jgi:ubiquinone biosynthesis protein
VSRFNWRVMLVQFASNAVVIGVLIAVLPGFKLHARHVVLAVVWLAVVFGVLSALVRPALEFLFLPYLLQSLGLVVIVITAVLLALLGLSSTLEIDGIGALAAGAVLAGGLGFFLDSLLGLTPPVVDDVSARAERRERTVRLAAISERLRLMQLYGLLVQYIADVAFDWRFVRPFRRRMQEWLWRPPVPIVPLPLQVKVRLLLEDLGPTYVKLGQIVSSQGRVLPPAWEAELEKLQSGVRPFSYDDVRAIVLDSLGGLPETLYASFDPTPLAAASLAQVHAATTEDGRRVAVKVQRPNIHEQLRSDIRILERGAAVLEPGVPWAADADLSGVVHEFGTTLLRELDYTVEAYNARRLERVIAPIEGLHVPATVPSLSSSRVLTLEFIEGVKATDIARIEAAGLDRQELARNFVRGAVKMVMIDGFFHADPHPGNIMVELGSGRLTFLDTGMVGELDVGQRITLARFLLAFRDKDVSGLATTLRSLSTPFRTPDDSSYQRQFTQRIGPLIDPPPGHAFPLEKLVTEALDVLRGAGYRLDAQLTLGMKAIAQAEAITSALLPGADASEFAQLGGAALEELAPDALSSGGMRTTARRQAIAAAGNIAERLPRLKGAAATWLDQLEKGEVPVRVRRVDLDDEASRLQAVPRLISASIAMAGLMIGSAIAAGLDTGKSGFRSVLADAAFVVFACSTVAAVTLVAVLVWRLLRPGARHRRARGIGG